MAFSFLTDPNVPDFFRVARKALGPPWLVANGESELVGYVLDLVKDGFTERARKGLLARFPQNDPTGQKTAPDDALAAIGRDRRIVRGIEETAQSYAARLTQWLIAWKTAGNPFGLMAQLRGYTGDVAAFRTVDVKGDWFSLNVDGTTSVQLSQGNWDWDGDPAALTKWSRFWVVIYPNGLWQPQANLGSPGLILGRPAATIGTTATTSDVSAIKSIVSAWKPAGCRCQNIIIAFDNTSFDPSHPRDGAGLPDGHWGHWSKVIAGTPMQYVAARLSSARFWDGA